MDDAGIDQRWRHVIFSTHCAWLPGDRRGWRSRHYKRHSSGDYKNPPPEREHQGLRDWARGNSGGPVLIPPALRSVIGLALVDHLRGAGRLVLTCAVDDRHAHLLVQLPDDGPMMRRIIGDAKRMASKAVRSRWPGRVWAGGGTFKLVRDREHQRRVYRYVLYDQGPKAWSWSYKVGVVNDPA